MFSLGKRSYSISLDQCVNVCVNGEGSFNGFLFKLSSRFFWIYLVNEHTGNKAFRCPLASRVFCDVT